MTPQREINELSRYWPIRLALDNVSGSKKGPHAFILAACDNFTANLRASGPRRDSGKHHILQSLFAQEMMVIIFQLISGLCRLAAVISGPIVSDIQLTD